MNSVDEKSVTALVDEAFDCLMRSLENVLEKQTGSMQIRDEGKRKMARERLLASYVDVAKSLHAHELGNIPEQLALIGDARQKIAEMRDKLSRVGA